MAVTSQKITHPDFKQIACDILDSTKRELDLESAIIAALRHVWNARGAADFEIVTSEHRLASPMVMQEIKRLDR